MRAVFTGLVAAAIAGGCSVDARSQGFACTGDGQCSGDRVCEQGWCVTGSRSDASVDDGSACPGACTACIGDTCEIDCSDPAACDAGDVVCPAGFVCEVDCSADGTCDGNIDCSDAVDCRVLCGGVGSCNGDITCTATGDCRVDCDGDGSCDGDISSGAGRTDVNCNGADSCNGSIDCAASCACEVDCVDQCPELAICPMGAACQANDGGCNDVGQCNGC